MKLHEGQKKNKKKIIIIDREIRILFASKQSKPQIRTRYSNWLGFIQTLFFVNFDRTYRVEFFPTHLNARILGC